MGGMVLGLGHDLQALHELESVEALWEPGSFFRWREVEVKNNRLGAPYLSFSSRLAAHLAAEGVKATHLSLSHSGNYAVAQVILEGE